MKLTPGRFRLFLNLYPPYVFAGVRVTYVAPDWRELHVQMKLRWYNRNAVGTHFGGSLYSMVDPHYMLMLMHILGRDYIVWDQAATIQFRRPGRGRVRSVAKITDEMLDRIRDKTKGGEAYRPEFEIDIDIDIDIDIVDDDEEIVATVTKVLYVRRKRTGDEH